MSGAYEKSIMAGVCPDCGKPMKVYSWSQIQEAKVSIGMGDGDDFFDCCHECAKAYFPDAYIPACRQIL